MVCVGGFNFGPSRKVVPYSGEFATFASQLDRNGKVKKQHVEPVRATTVLKKHGNSSELAKAMQRSVQPNFMKVDKDRKNFRKHSGTAYYAGTRGSDHIFITNRHVIESIIGKTSELGEIDIAYSQDYGHRRFGLGELVVKDYAICEDADLGIFVVNPSESSAPLPDFTVEPATFTHRDIEIGEQVAGIGYPDGGDLTILPGKVLIAAEGTKDFVNLEWKWLSKQEYKERKRNGEFTSWQYFRNLVHWNLLNDYSSHEVEGMKDIPSDPKKHLTIHSVASKGVSGSPIYERNGHVAGTASFIRDVSEVKISIGNKLIRWYVGYPADDHTIHAITAKDTTGFLDSQGIEYELA